MSKLWAALRRLLGRKEDKKESTHVPNDVQKVENRLHPYDDVEICGDGTGVAVNVQQNTRAPRPYDEVGPPDDEGKVEIKEVP